MEATVGVLSAQVGGEVVGNPDLLMKDAQALGKAVGCEVSFLGSDTRIGEIEGSQAGAILIARKRLDELSATVRAQHTFIVVVDVLDAFLTILRQFRTARPRAAIGISPQAIVSGSAVIGENTNIYPGAYIGDDVVIGANCDLYPGVFVGDGTRIGDDVTIHPQAVLYNDVSIGSRVIIHASVVIGADGFGFRFRDGRYHKIPQLGTVRIEDDVEIGACSTIDRGMIGPTIIGEGTKLDNLVMVAHNCEIGKHNVFASQVGVSGSATTGDYVRCGGQVGVANQVHLGQGSSIGAKSGVHRDVPADATYVGYPARPHDETFKIVMAEQKLPEMRIKLRELEKQVTKLSAAVAAISETTSDAA